MTEQQRRNLIDRVITDVATPVELERFESLMVSDRAFARDVARHAAMVGDLINRRGSAAAPAAPEAVPVYRAEHESKARGRWPIYCGLAAAAVVAIAATLYVVFPTTDQVDPPTPPSQEPIATLIETTGGELFTPGGFIAEGSQYTAGEYSIDGGHAQFVLNNRVTVDLHGTTNLYMHSNQSVYLSRGEARFNVPSDARGFTVHLPDKSKIVDLGTAFTVTIGDGGEVNCFVTGGRVAWFDAKPDAQPVFIEAGHRIRINDGKHVVLAEAPKTDPDPPTDPQPPVEPGDVVWGDPVAIAITNPSFEDGAKGWSSEMGGIKATRTAEEFGYAAPDGDHAIFAYGGVHRTAQVLSATLEANTRYTLQVDVLRRGDDEPLINSMLALGAGEPGTLGKHGSPDANENGIKLALINSKMPEAPTPDAPGKFTTWTLTFTTGSSHEALGKPLWIKLGARGNTTNGSAAYDNVRLTAAKAVARKNHDPKATDNEDEADGN